jgi:hypothetical protein
VARLKLRDRIYNRKVAHAMTSPLGILAAGGGAAVGLAVGLPILVAVGLGAAAWAIRVAVAMPRGIDLDGIDPFQLADPWRSYVWRAKHAKRLYFDAVNGAHHGPLRDRLDDIGGRIETGVAECWQIARSGQAMSQARARLDTQAIQNELTQLTWNAGGGIEPGSSKAETIQALESQLATAARLDQLIADTSDRLQLLDARLDEAVARAVELSARGQRVEDLGSVASDVDSVVSDMESLRLALDETDRMTDRMTEHEPVWPADAASPGAPSPVTAPPADAPAAGVPPLAALPADDAASAVPTMPTTEPAPAPSPAAEPPPSAPKQRPA